MGRFTRRMYRQFVATRRETGFRSKFEVAINDALVATSTEAAYEAVHLQYKLEVTRSYVPDWIMPKQCIVLEAKGKFDKADRDKMLLLKQQYPDLDIRIVFQDPNGKITKAVTYAMWCEQHGFPFCKGPHLPTNWTYHHPAMSQRRAFANAFPTYSDLEITDGKPGKRVRPSRTVPRLQKQG